jgi:drug/metabolite transporter (DMT)-like permease
MLAAMALFSLMAICGRLATRTMSAPQLAFLRFAFMLAALLVLFCTGRAKLSPCNLRLLVLRGLFGGGAVLLYFIAIERCRDAGTATLLNCMSPVFTGLFAWLFLDEKPRLRLAAGLLLAFAGVFLVLRSPGGLDLGSGEMAGLASAVLSGFAVVTLRASRAYDNAPTILLALGLGGALLSSPFAAARWNPASQSVWALAGAVGLLSLCAQLMMTHAYGLVTAGRGAVFHQLIPVLTYGLGAALLGEKLTATGVAGTLVTLGAVVYAAWPGEEA